MMPSPTEATLISAAVSAVVSIIVTAIGLTVQGQRFRTERNQVLRGELAELVALLDRGLFTAGLDREDPVEMYLAINETRTQLRKSGARFFRDSAAAAAFQKIIAELEYMETRVRAAYPQLVALAAEFSNGVVDRGRVSQTLQHHGFQAIHVMMELRTKVEEAMKTLHLRLKQLSD